MKDGRKSNYIAVDTDIHRKHVWMRRVTVSRCITRKPQKTAKCWEYSTGQAKEPHKEENLYDNEPFA